MTPHPAPRSSAPYITTRQPISRRRFLQGAGIALSLPFLDSMLPVFARASAKPQGDWSIVIRGDQTTQWAYKGKPIYNYFASTDLKEVLDVVDHNPHWHKLVP